MPLCGFNQKMLEGLTAFHEGLVEHGLIERSRIRGQTIDETLQRELTDMERFLNETPRIENPEVRVIVENLTRYAEAFYKLLQKEGVDNSERIIKRLNALYLNMDHKFYSELEGQEDDMKKLAEHLNNQYPEL
jgi:hypothetical protein